jgi:hypothetical protein
MSGSPLKFRVWDGSQMHEPSVDNNKHIEFYRTEHEWALVESTTMDFGEVMHEPERVIATSSDESSVLMRAAGLTDSEGTEVYEDDYLSYEDSSGNECMGVVTYRRGSFQVTDMTQPHPYRSLHSFGRGPTSARIGKVLGNRHEDSKPL